MNETNITEDIKGLAEGVLDDKMDVTLVYPDSGSGFRKGFAAGAIGTAAAYAIYKLGRKVYKKIKYKKNNKVAETTNVVDEVIDDEE